MYHCRVKGKTLRQKFRESSLQGPAEATVLWHMLEMCRSFLTNRQMVVAQVIIPPTIPAAPCALCPTRNSVSSFSYDLQIAY